MAQKILVLGARSDIGISIARCFAMQGFDVQLAARRAAELEKTAKDIAIRSQQDVTLHEFDVLDYASHDNFIAGLPVLPNIVVSVIGLLGEQQSAQQNWQQAKLIIDSNYSGPVSILNRFANLFEQRNSGCIIGVSSVAGDRGRQSNYIYGSAKAGLSEYLSGLRNRLHKSGVQVITVKPGFVKTAMTASMELPDKLTALPEQVAADVFAAFTHHKNIIYSRWFWRWIMLIIKMLPENLFKRLNL